MKLSINDLLTNFAEDKLIAPKALEKKIAANDPVLLEKLQIALKALERIGILIKERGKYRRILEDSVIEGKLRCSSKGFCFAIQDDEDAEDIYVRESQLNTAWNGDRVLVKVTKEGRRRRSPEGEVRLILERANASVIARVQQTEKGNYQAVPLDDRLLFSIDLQENEAEPKLAAAKDQLVHVEILRYPLARQRPIGRVTHILGSDAQSTADTELVHCKYDLPRTFRDGVLQAAETLPTKLRKTDQKKRVALQQQLMVTLCDPNIEPMGLDHAFSLEQTEEGNWQLGVHVSDFAHFISPPSELYREAHDRGRTICLGNTLVPLFPTTLVERVGALLPGVDRLAISVLITLNGNGEWLEFEIQPTVVQVDRQLSYQQVEEILAVHAAGKIEEAPDRGLAPIAELLHHLKQLSQVLHHQRFQRGSFDLMLSTPSSQICGDEGWLGAIVNTQQGSAPQMVAEFSTLANHLVISHLTALGIPAIYAIQAPPDLQDIQNLVNLLGNLALPVNLNLEEMVQPQALQTLTQRFQESDVAPILFELLKATLKSVKYSTVSGPHFGLAHVQNYGQFTAPLNRYCDLVHHRVLHALFAKGRDRRNTRAKERVNLHHSSCHGQIHWNVLPPDIQRELEAEIAAAVTHLNEREQLVQQAETDLVGLQKTKKMQTHTGDVLQGIITGIQSYGFFVRVEALMAEGLVHVSSLKDDWYEYRARQQALIGRKNHCQYRLGDRVEVEVKSVDYYRQQIDLIVVGGGSTASDEDLMDSSEDEAVSSELEDEATLFDPADDADDVDDADDADDAALD